MQIASVEVPLAVTVNIPTFWNVVLCYLQNLVDIDEHSASGFGRIFIRIW
jgi:hypothetical protein